MKSLTLFAIFFCSCKNLVLNEPVVISDVYRVNSEICHFDVMGRSGFNDKADATAKSVSFQDTCFKFSIGDTVSFIAIKR